MGFVAMETDKQQRVAEAHAQSVSLWTLASPIAAGPELGALSRQPAVRGASNQCSQGRR